MLEQHHGTRAGHHVPRHARKRRPHGPRCRRCNGSATRSGSIATPCCSRAVQGLAAWPAMPLCPRSCVACWRLWKPTELAGARCGPDRILPLREFRGRRGGRRCTDQAGEARYSRAGCDTSWVTPAASEVSETTADAVREPPVRAGPCIMMPNLFELLKSDETGATAQVEIEVVALLLGCPKRLIVTSAIETATHISRSPVSAESATDHFYDATCPAQRRGRCLSPGAADGIRSLGDDPLMTRSKSGSQGPRPHPRGQSTPAGTAALDNGKGCFSR